MPAIGDQIPSEFTVMSIKRLREHSNAAMRRRRQTSLHHRTAAESAYDLIHDGGIGHGHGFVDIYYHSDNALA
jgi:hypothetical protein